MKIGEVYGSGNFLKATARGTLGIKGEPSSLILTIGGPLIEHTFDDGKKQMVINKWKNPPLPEKEMPTLGLNATNARALATIAGTDETDNWIGLTFEVFTMPEAKSPTGWAIRVKRPAATSGYIAQAQTASAQPREAEPIGEANAITLANKLAAMGRDATQLRDYLRVCGIANNDAISAPVPTWPRGWFETIKKYLQDPVGALQEASMNASPKSDDIPF